MISSEADKAELRRRMRGMRKSIPHEAAASSARAAADVIDALPFFRAAAKVALYAPVRAELPTSVVDGRLRARGTLVYYPRVVPAERRIVFHRVDDPGALRPGPFEVPEPDPLAPVATIGEIDVIVVPGLAFDERGSRLGYGMGFYDRALPGARAGTSVGFCYDFQLVPAIPVTNEDRPVAWVVTDRRAVEAFRRRS